MGDPRERQDGRHRFEDPDTGAIKESETKEEEGGSIEDIALGIYGLIVYLDHVMEMRTG